jgi:hypothetical protein
MTAAKRKKPLPIRKRIQGFAKARERTSVTKERRSGWCPSRY